jgi:DNA-nicking Smr family endonuclease
VKAAAKVHSLAELKLLRDALAERQRQARERAAAERAAERATQRSRRLFADSVGPVTPLPAHGLAAAVLQGQRPAPLPRQREADERNALAEAMSDEVDVETLLLTDDGLSFRREGVGEDVVVRLRRGQWAVQATLDLHGHTREDAREALAQFLRESRQRGWRCLRVVHGKGLGSPGRQPVLKGKVQRWLGQSQEVLAFTQASAPQGGAGALVVLLRG